MSTLAGLVTRTAVTGALVVAGCMTAVPAQARTSPVNVDSEGTGRVVVGDTGRFRVDWGDQAPGMAGRCRDRPCLVRHAYTHSGRYSVTVTTRRGTRTYALSVFLPLANTWREDTRRALNELRPPDKPLLVCARLDRAAQAHAEALADSGTVSHTGPDGSTPLERVTGVGYEPAALGENIAHGLLDPGSVVAGWNASTSHHATILDETYTHVGVGAANTALGRVWVTEYAHGGTC